MFVDKEYLIARIDRINLEAVLAAHGVHRADDQNEADRIACFCPFCGRPSTPHFIIYKMVHGGLYGGVKWFCTKTKKCGYGAIALQAALMGCTTTGVHLLRVCKELCRIAQWGELPELSVRPMEKEVAPQPKVLCDRMVDFTPEGLLALGCRVTPSIVNAPNEKPEYTFAFSPFGDKSKAFNSMSLHEDFGLYQLSGYTTAAQHRKGGEVSIHYEATPFAPIFLLVDPRVSKHSGKEYKVCRIIHSAQPQRDFLFVEGEGTTDKAKRQLTGDRVFRAFLGGEQVVDAVKEIGTEEYLQRTKVSTVADGNDVIEREEALRPEDVRAESVVYCESPLDAIPAFYHLNALRDSYQKQEEMRKIYFHVAFPLLPHTEFSSTHSYQLTRFARQSFVLFSADNEGKKHTFQIGKRHRQLRMAFLPATFMDNRRAADKSVRNFFLHHHMSEDEGYAFSFDINRLFLSCFTSALTANPLEYCEKLDKKTGKVKEYWYRINSASLWPFMASEGYCREVDHDSTNTIGRFIRLDGPFVKEIDSHSVVAATTAALSTYAQQTARVGTQDYEKMMNAIIMAKEINEKTAVNLPEIEIDYSDGYGPKVDHFFYQNGALRITPESITFHPYSELDFNVDRAEILPWDFTMPVAAGENPPFRLIENPEYVQRMNAIEEHRKDTAHYTLQEVAEERGQLMEWSQTHRWTFDFFGKKEEELWPALRVLRCFANEEWEKEEELKRKGKTFDEKDKNLLYGHLANLIFSLGRPLFRYRNTAHNCIPYLLENKVSSENKAEGGSGKSVFVNLFMGCAGKILKIDGRNIKADKEFSLHLASYQHHCHRVVHWEDLDSVPLTDLYNYATSGFSYRRLFQDVTTIKFSESPGHIISSNKSPLKADDSTMRRISLAGFSHRFAGENVHKNKPARLISDVMPGFQTEPELLSPTDRNQIAYICALAVQFCMNCPDKVSAPQTDVKNRTMSRNLGESFVRWATSFFSQSWVYNCPIDRDTIFSEYIDFCEASEDKQTKFSAATFRDKLKQYCELNSIVFVPKICLTSRTEEERGYLRRKAWQIVKYFDDRRVWGNRPQKNIRELKYSNLSLWFSKRGEEPKTKEDFLKIYELFCEAKDPAPILDAEGQPVVLTDEEKEEWTNYYNRRQGKYVAPGASASPATVDTKNAKKPEEELPF